MVHRGACNVVWAVWLLATVGMLIAPGDALGQCSITCPSGAASEPEECGVSANDGCNLIVPTYTQVSCGTTVCGTAWAQNGDRDSDWYTFDLADPDGDGIGQVSATVSAAFPAVFFILNNDCSNILAFAQGQVENCETRTITACVNAPGTYRVFVAPGTASGAIFDGIVCGGDNRYWMTVTCENGCTPPVNDACIDAVPIEDGASFFDTVNATTDGPGHAACDPEGGGDTVIHHDVWYAYTATCTGDLIVDACNSANFDTRIAIYDGCACPANEASLLACNDEMFGCEGGTSALFAPVVAGRCYLIRVGGFTGAEGLGTIRLDCFAGGLCPDSGDCTVANGSPGCSDASCCGSVCDVDPYCCLVDWDALCAQQAASLCTGAASEACCFGDGSCQDLAPTDCDTAGGIAQGAGSVCSTASCTVAATEACCIAEGACVNATIDDCANIGGSPQGEGTSCGGELTCFSEACCLVDESCIELTRDECNAVGGAPVGPGSTCEETACGTAAWEACCLSSGECFNVATVDCLAQGGSPQGADSSCVTGPCVFTCPSDIAPVGAVDGMVDIVDLLELLGNWGPCRQPCAQDIVDDGVINITDLLSVLSAWGPCP